MRPEIRSSGAGKAVAVCAAALSLITAPGVAHAQLQVSTTPSAPALGRMVRGSSATTFTVSNAGVVTRSSGDGIRISNASATAPTVTISCGFLNVSSLCALRQIRVTVQPVASTATQITRFTVGSPQGNMVWANGSPPPPGSSVTFDIKPMGLLGTGTFTLGMDVWTAAGVASGNYNFSYTVTAAFI